MAQALGQSIGEIGSTMQHDELLSLGDTAGYLAQNVLRGNACTATNLYHKCHTDPPINFLLHGMETWKSQSQGFIPAIHTIECLHCIACRAFHQIVQRSDNHNPLLLRIKLKTNITEVAPGKNLGFRIAVDTAALFHNADKWLVLVSFSIESPQGTLVHCLLHKDMCRDEDSAYQLNRGSGKGDALRRVRIYVECRFIEHVSLSTLQ